jgi:hypothetical protein
VSAHVNNLVDEGVYNVGEMKRHVRMFVKNLLADNSIPSVINRRFFPSREDLRKMIYRRRQHNLHGLLDQQYFSEKVTNWKSERPSDCWYVRLSGQQGDEPGVHNSLLIVYQSEWQKRLLNMYGQELVFLDATYKTTQYALPLFFLVVHSNNGYIVVATIVVENEDTASLSEALTIIAEWNERWSPKAFMVDASEIELNAIASVFHGMHSLFLLLSYILTVQF